MNRHMTSRRVVAVALTALVGGFVPVATPGAAHGADDHPTAYRAVPFSGTIDGVHTSRTPGAAAAAAMSIRATRPLPMPAPRM